MNFRDAQANFELQRESLACGDYDRDPPEVTDEHREKAIEEMILKDPVSLSDFYNDSAFWKEHISYLADHSKEFRKELMQWNRIEERAQKIANEEAEAAREQSERDAVEAAFDD